MLGHEFAETLRKLGIHSQSRECMLENNNIALGEIWYEVAVSAGGGGGNSWTGTMPARSRTHHPWITIS